MNARANLHAVGPFRIIDGRGIIDNRGRVVALMPNNPLLWALQYVKERARNDTANAEFWRRLAGSIYKAMTIA